MKDYAKPITPFRRFITLTFVLFELLSILLTIPLILLVYLSFTGINSVEEFEPKECIVKDGRITLLDQKANAFLFKERSSSNDNLCDSTEYSLLYTGNHFLPCSYSALENGSIILDHFPALKKQLVPSIMIWLSLWLYIVTLFFGIPFLFRRALRAIKATTIDDLKHSRHEYRGIALLGVIIITTIIAVRLFYADYSRSQLKDYTAEKCTVIGICKEPTWLIFERQSGEKTYRASSENASEASKQKLHELM